MAYSYQWGISHIHYFICPTGVMLLGLNVEYSMMQGYHILASVFAIIRSITDVRRDEDGTRCPMTLKARACDLGRYQCQMQLYMYEIYWYVSEAVIVSHSCQHRAAFSQKHHADVTLQHTKITWKITSKCAWFPCHYFANSQLTVVSGELHNRGM